MFIYFNTCKMGDNCYTHFRYLCFCISAVLFQCHDSGDYKLWPPMVHHSENLQANYVSYFIRLRYTQQFAGTQPPHMRVTCIYIYIYIYISTSLLTR
jgi:hypothetical protein